MLLFILYERIRCQLQIVKIKIYKTNRPVSRGTCDINLKVAVTLSPSVTILTFSGNSTFPVTPAVLK